MSEAKEKLYYVRLKARYERVLEVQASNEQEAYDRAMVQSTSSDSGDLEFVEYEAPTLDHDVVEALTELGPYYPSH